MRTDSQALKATLERLKEKRVKADIVKKPVIEGDILPFTKLVSDDITQEMVNQDQFGLKKYGKPLDPMDGKYDWLHMAQQELADCLKYFKAEEVRRNHNLSESINILEKLMPALENTIVKFIDVRVKESGWWGKEFEEVEFPVNVGEALFAVVELLSELKGQKEE